LGARTGYGIFEGKLYREYNLSTHPYKLYNDFCKRCHLNNNTFTSELVDDAHFTAWILYILPE
jgi:hypothetical protein